MIQQGLAIRPISLRGFYKLEISLLDKFLMIFPFQSQSNSTLQRMFEYIFLWKKHHVSMICFITSEKKTSSYGKPWKNHWFLHDLPMILMKTSSKHHFSHGFSRLVVSTKAAIFSAKALQPLRRSARTCRLFWGTQFRKSPCLELCIIYIYIYLYIYNCIYKFHLLRWLINYNYHYST